MVANGCTGVRRLARAFTRTSLKMTEGESIAEIAERARDRETRAYHRDTETRRAAKIEEGKLQHLMTRIGNRCPDNPPDIRNLHF